MVEASVGYDRSRAKIRQPDLCRYSRPVGSVEGQTGEGQARILRVTGLELESVHVTARASCPAVQGW
jgi:hypothetical protein